MTIAPIDIRNREFHKAFRGYETEEVEKFIDMVSKDYETLYTEILTNKDKVRQLESQLAQYQQLESTLQQTLVIAQQTAEEVKSTARQEAELIIRSAEQEKERQMAEARQQWEEIQNEIQELRRKREIIRTHLKSFLMSHLELSESQKEEHTDVS